MKILKIIFLTFLGLVLLAACFVAWFCTGSFVYQASIQKEFVIDAPISVVCKRAMNIKPKPETEERAVPKIDMQQAAKNYSLGQPIEFEVEHPKLGTIKLGIKINLEAEPNSVKIRGKVVTLDPRLIEKFGKPIAEVEDVAFSLKVTARDEKGKEGGFFQFLSDSGTTVVELSFAPEIRVYFRELGILRSQMDRAVKKAEEKITQQVETFLDENLRKPTEEELAEQKAEEEKPAKEGSFWGRLKSGFKKNPPKETAPKAEEEDGEAIDVSALDEEI